MISIGAIYRGPELDESAVNAAIRRVGKAAIAARGNFAVGQCPSINVVFYVPGSLGKPDFQYISEGKFSRKQQLLLVAVPVPEEEVSNDDVMDFLIESLHGANAVAFAFFRRKGMDYPLKEAEALVAEIRESVAA